MDVNTLIKEKGKDFKLELLAGSGGLNRKITVCDLNRPGLAFAGFFEHFPYKRVQVIGLSEYEYLIRLSYDVQVEILSRIFSHEDATCCILTRGFKPTDAMIKVFTGLNVPLLRTEFMFSSLMGDLAHYFDGKFAPSVKMHGVLINVYGLGILIIGKSSMGKSECAIELVKRGHKFVADDVVNVIKRSGNNLIGSSLEITKNLIEVRGIGIINIKDIFGIGNILDETNIELVIKFEEWKYVKEYDRLGINENYTEILKVRVPEVKVPVGPSRNLAVLVETASLNQRLKNKGHFTARDLDDRLLKEINNV